MNIRNSFLAGAAILALVGAVATPAAAAKHHHMMKHHAVSSTDSQEDQKTADLNRQQMNGGGAMSSSSMPGGGAMGTGAGGSTMGSTNVNNDATSRKTMMPSETGSPSQPQTVPNTNAAARPTDSTPTGSH